MACKRMHGAMLGVSLAATTRNVVDTIFVLEARDIEGKVLRGGIHWRHCPSRTAQDPEVLGKNASVGENLGDIAQRGCIAVRELIALVM